MTYKGAVQKNDYYHHSNVPRAQLHMNNNRLKAEKVK